MTYPIKPGFRYPHGATLDAEGVNFSIFSRHATHVELWLYASGDSQEPLQVIRLDSEAHCTFFSWHVYVVGLPGGMYYIWRLHGPDPSEEPSLRFDPDKHLLDPWAKAVYTRRWDRWRASAPGDNGPTAMRAVVVADDDYDWEGDQPLMTNAGETIIYEVHVGGFTRHPSANVTNPGSFAGLQEKIPYLQELGITHVELMPVMAFDDQDIPPGARNLGLKNFWGYSSHSFMCTHPGYCVSPDPCAHRREFRDMVKAMHRAGIGVILDVVLNHTAEGDGLGPTIHFKGMANDIFYHLEPDSPGQYRNYSGCGNALNCNHPLVSRFILQVLEYWVREMHVDGFRFDLASVLARGEDGEPMRHPPVLWSIELSDVLARKPLIAEAWDAGGLYQVGDFPGLRWSEWNGRYRDIVRRFVRGEPGLIGEMATRLSGSSDMYVPHGRLPINSINFVTCHDGFTLWDLVSYNRKHNEANGEQNRDGADDNWSWNCGKEGETNDGNILLLRRRQAKNLLAILMLSIGVPMVRAGDEFLDTQYGNNNVYCQDNELGWLDWEQARSNADMLRFTRSLIALRKRHPCLMRERFLSGRAKHGELPDVTWHGRRLHEPLWDDPTARLLVFTRGNETPQEPPLHVILNMSDLPEELPLPELPELHWYRTLDTARIAPDDAPALEQREPLDGQRCNVQAHSVVVLEALPTKPWI